MRVPLIAATLLAAAAAQQPTPKPAPPLDRTLTAVLQEIRSTAHAFEGRLTWGPEPQGGALIDTLDLVFAGGTQADADGELRWHSLLGWTVLQRGERHATRQLTSAEDPAAAPVDSGWQVPQGDAPEVPLTPQMLLALLPYAALGRPEPADVADRPALRVLARWQGKAAKQAVLALATPSSSHEMILEALANAVHKHPEQCTVDAEIRYDPASKRWLAATLRVLLLDGQAHPADEPPLPAPEGMPAPTSRPIVELLLTLQRREPEELPAPTLDQRAHELLQPRR